MKISSIFVAFLENMNFKHTTDFEERRNKNLVAVAEARKKVQSEISDLKEKVKIGRDTVAKFKSEILRCQTERGFQNPAGSATAALLWAFYIIEKFKSLFFSSLGQRVKTNLNYKICIAFKLVVIQILIDF